MHLEEACNQLEELRTQNTQTLMEIIPQIEHHLPILGNLFAKIEQCDVFIKQVGELIVKYEKLMTKAESQLTNRNKVRRLISSLISKRNDLNQSNAIEIDNLPSIDLSSYLSKSNETHEDPK